MKFKHLLILPLLAAAGLTAQAQITANTTVKINLNVNAMQNPDCWLNQGVVNNGKVYMHSGLCTSGSSFCDANVVASGSNAWEHVVGNWGVDDNIGLMTNEGSNRWSITFMVYDYFSNNISVGSTAMAPGDIPYVMGLVFRSDDGTYEGKDVQCNDIFIRNLQSTPQVVSSSDLTTFAPVTIDVLAGLDDAQSLGALDIYPNPSQSLLNIEYFLGKSLENVSVKVTNLMGQEVAQLFSGNQPAGTQRIQWDGKGIHGQSLAKGMYLVSIAANGTPLATQKIIRD